MEAGRATVLYVTDLAYDARGRRYCDEDIFLSARLRERFTVGLCHPRDVTALMDSFDVVVVRNSGPVLHHLDHYRAFGSRALARGIPTYNPLTGKADMAGKDYLVDLTARGYPVIPTVDRRSVHRLPPAEEYVVKPRLGADSIGLRIVDKSRLDALAVGDDLVQPRIDFRYEVSFYFVDRDFHYALYAPRPGQRWALERYDPREADLAFAQRFIDWNALDHGIQRVDACRTRDGDLLLVELEDLNPYLSLDLLDAPTRERFVAAMTASIADLLERRRAERASHAG